MNNIRVCPCCNNGSAFRLKKGLTDYYQCSNCRTIFSMPLNNENMIGGGAHEERNTIQNPLRISRAEGITNGIKKEDVYILDFGCGFFRLGDDLKKAGFVNTFGFDLYNPEFSKLPEKNKFDLVISVETFEHFSFPFSEIDVIHRSLKKGGICYIETGFLNAAWDDGVSDEDNPYINPLVGHSIIYTYHGIDLLMSLKGFSPVPKINRHCHLYRKN